MAVKKTRKLPGSVWLYLFLKDGEFTVVKRDAVLSTSVWKRHHFCQKRYKKSWIRCWTTGRSLPVQNLVEYPPPGENTEHCLLQLVSQSVLFSFMMFEKVAHGITYWEVELGCTLRSDTPNAAARISRTTECNALPVICVATKIRDKLPETWPIAVLLRWELTILMPAYAEYPMM